MKIKMTIRKFCEFCSEDEDYEARVFDVGTGDVVFYGSLEDVMNCQYANHELWDVSLLRDNIIVFNIFINIFIGEE